MKVHVFKTNITNDTDADSICLELNRALDLNSINFDLDDCDNILRIESSNITNTEVVYQVKVLGFECSPL